MSVDGSNSLRNYTLVTSENHGTSHFRALFISDVHLGTRGCQAERLLDFQYYWESAARPFEWKFTRQDLANLLAKIENIRPQA